MRSPACCGARRPRTARTRAFRPAAPAPSNAAAIPGRRSRCRPARDQGSRAVTTSRSTVALALFVQFGATLVIGFAVWVAVGLDNLLFDVRGIADYLAGGVLIAVR